MIKYGGGMEGDLGPTSHEEHDSPGRFSLGARIPKSQSKIWHLPRYWLVLVRLWLVDSFRSPPQERAWFPVPQWSQSTNGYGPQSHGEHTEQ